MFAEERRKLILKKITSEGRALAKDLALEFKVSIDTIRRDLSIMEEEKLIKRTHGGAIPPPKVRNKPLIPEVRNNIFTTEQEAIAKLAVKFIEENHTIFIGSASVHHALIKYLPNNLNYTVVTNSVFIAEKLLHFDNIESYMICGKINKNGSLADIMAIEFIKNLRIDIGFLSCGGLSSSHGLSTSTPEMATLLKTVASVSRKKIALASYKKIHNEFFAKIIDAEDTDIIITDWEAPKDEIQSLRNIGLEVLVAENQI